MSKTINQEKRDIREIFWNYPTTLYRFHKGTKPLSAILTSLLLGVLLFKLLLSPYLIKSLAKEADSLFVEGTVGTITSLNPIFTSQNYVDRDLHALIYSRFINIGSEGEILPGVAERWTSRDSVYTFYLTEGINWHDGVPLTADDVAFTFTKSIELAERLGVDTVGSDLTSLKISKVEDYVVRIELPENNASVLESLAVYIVPEHILETLRDEDYFDYGMNVPPIGSGPFRVTSNNPGYLDFERVDRVNGGINAIRYRAFPDLKSLEVAFKNRLLDSVSNLTQSELQFASGYKNYTLYSTTIEQRKKLIFINTTGKLTGQIAIRKALAYCTDREKLISQSYADGIPTVGPLASNSWAASEEIDFYPKSVQKGKNEIKALGYKKSEDGYYYDKDGNLLSLRFTYLDNKVNESIAQSLISMWASCGIKVDSDRRSFTSMVNEVLATRQFDLLMFQLETSVDPDQYNLWHSSKVNYPDLNISGYKFDRVDILLERARTSNDRSQRREDYDLFQSYLAVDVPVLFLYEPKFNYLVDGNIKGIDLESMNFPDERFREIGSWAANL